MKCSFSDFCFLAAVIIITPLFCAGIKPSNVKRFIIVSNFVAARTLYNEIRWKDQEPLDNIEDEATRRTICKDIFGNLKFIARKEYPIEKLRHRFNLKVSADYSNKEIQVSVGNGILFDEHEAFLCRTRQKTGFTEYFVSREYNLLDEWNSVAARFVFHFSEFSKEKTVDFVAEEPANALISTDYAIEDIYLQRRVGLMPSRSRIDDPLCKLKKAEKLRICLAVFNSVYFTKRLRYPVSKIGKIRGTCELETVFFQTERAKPHTSSKKFQEWMLSCQPGKNRFKYFLSHAYRSHEIFIYARHQETEIFLENLSLNVRVTLNEESFRFFSKDNTYDMSDDYLYVQTKLSKYAYAAFPLPPRES